MKRSRLRRWAAWCALGVFVVSFVGMFTLDLPWFVAQPSILCGLVAWMLLLKRDDSGDG